MQLERRCAARLTLLCALALVPPGLTCLQSAALAQEAPGFAAPSSQAAPSADEPVDPPEAAHPPQSGTAVGQYPPGAGVDYDPAIFGKPIPKDQLASLVQFAGGRSGDVWHDKQFRRVAKQIIPDCTFHYGSDKSFETAMDEMLTGSGDPAVLREGRYLVISGRGQIVGGRGFLWIDLQDGVGSGGFYFHPTNGEPTPTLTVFSRQVREKALGMSDLPLPFAQDLSVWAGSKSVPPLTTRYFIGGINKRLLLEHDEDYCSPADGSPAPPTDVCEDMNAQAADIDMNTAYYLKQVNYATNATAWMITGADQTAWIGIRANTCGGVLNPIGCRIRMTREHIHVITGRAPRPPHPAPAPHPHR